MLLTIHQPKSKSGSLSALNVLGLMSGTSGDGIDGALVRFGKSGSFSLLWHDHFDFSPAQRNRLQSLMNQCSADDAALGSSYVAWIYGRAVRHFRETHPEPIDLLAAHGQTIAHVPQPRLWENQEIRGTLQALNGDWLAEDTGIPTVYNFRPRDMAVGGQGAPLVPFGDLCFFQKVPGNSAILNIGGIANLTIIRKTPLPEVAAAFDTGPGNMLMDALIQEETRGESMYDEGGAIGKSGCTNTKLVSNILADPYFSEPPPKSTGRDRFGKARLMEIRKNFPNVSFPDLVSSFLDLTVSSIALALDRFVLPGGPLDRLVVAGGGALNTELMKRLAKRLRRSCMVERSDPYGVPVMAREAMAFAALGNAFVRGIPGNVPVATGARRKVVLGSFAPGRRI